MILLAPQKRREFPISLELISPKQYPSAIKKIDGCLLVAVLCMGCTAHMMETHGDKVFLFASAKEKQGRGGVIRYLNTGLDSWKQSRREDATKQMQRFCSGPYRII